MDTIAGKTVLFIEDDSSISELIKAYFSAVDLKISLANSGKEAIDLFDSNDFGVVITDLHLPDIDAKELIAELNKKDPSVVIVVTSGSLHSENTDLDEYIWEYVEKPYKLESLLHVIKKGIEYGKLLKENISLKNKVNYQRIDKKYYQFFNQSPNIILILDKEGKIVDCNLRAKQVWGKHLSKIDNILELGLAFDMDGLKQIKRYFSVGLGEYIQFYSYPNNKKMLFFLEPVFNKGNLEFLVAEWHECGE
jgi:DNA-binding response OmpR family regulator